MSSIVQTDEATSSLGVFVLRIQYHLVAVAEFDQLSAVHDGDAVAQVVDHVKVVRDEQVSQAEPGLEVLQQVDDLGLES